MQILLKSIRVPPATTGRFVRESGILLILLEIGMAWLDGMVFGSNWSTWKLHGHRVSSMRNGVKGSE